MILTTLVALKIPMVVTTNDTNNPNGPNNPSRTNHLTTLTVQITLIIIHNRINKPNIINIDNLYSTANTKPPTDTKSPAKAIRAVCASIWKASLLDTVNAEIYTVCNIQLKAEWEYCTTWDMIT